MSNTATVEALTAEVRVLMVGNRQVTLSVFRQLDEVIADNESVEEFEPFGRVNSGFKYLPGEGKSRLPIYEFVGKSADGSLVRMGILREDMLSLRDESKQRVAEWSQLPLIVLAGLR